MARKSARGVRTDHPGGYPNARYLTNVDPDHLTAHTARMGQRIRPHVAAACLGTILAGMLIAVHVPAVAANSCMPQFDYAFQYTGTVNTFYHLPTCPQNGYFGWVGVNGQIVTPSHFPNLGNNNGNHSIGWLGVSFNDTPGPIGPSFTQEGWYAGCLGYQGKQICSTSSLHTYDEQYSGPTDTYWVFDNGPLSYSSGHVYRIEYSTTDSCWYIYFNYSTLVDALCSVPGSPIPSSAAMEAISEVASVSGAVIEMPKATYGYSSINTNSTLRIKGANGWVNWTPSLSSGGTIQWDERNSTPSYWLTTLRADYDIQGYGQCGNNC